MSHLYLLDTNVVSELIRPKPRAQVLERFKQRHAHLTIAAIVWHELWFGVRRLPDGAARRTRLERYLEQVVATLPMLPYDQRAAEWHAAERARLGGRGQAPPFADGQIAAIAAVNDLTLVTFNVADYACFQSLTVEDWRK
jgi:tRNA(fMet)-specific endonuclease VapC